MLDVLTLVVYGFVELYTLSLEPPYFQVLLGIKITVGVWIKPHILNIALLVVEKVLVTLIVLIVVPLLIAIRILQVVLDVVSFLLEVGWVQPPTRV